MWVEAIYLMLEACWAYSWTLAARSPTASPSRRPGGGAAAVEWPRYNASSDRHLRLADPPSAGAGYAKERCDFWDSLPEQTHYPH